MDAGDPLAGRGGLPPRDYAYRLRLALKELLRRHGLKCVVCRSPTPDELREAADWL